MSLKRFLSPLLSVYRLALDSGKEYRAPGAARRRLHVRRIAQERRIFTGFDASVKIVNDLNPGMR